MDFELSWWGFRDARISRCEAESFDRVFDREVMSRKGGRKVGLEWLL